jgi:hypothetical protein
MQSYALREPHILSYTIKGSPVYRGAVRAECKAPP